MILVDYPIHLTSKSNGSHGHWSSVARIAKRERAAILNLVDWEMLRVTDKPYRQPFQLRRVRYVGRFNGMKVVKTKFVRDLAPLWKARLEAGLVVTLTRYAEKPLDDDGLRRGFKHLRDGTADAFGIADNDPRIRFDYAQILKPPSRVTVAIAWAADLQVSEGV